MKIAIEYGRRISDNMEGILKLVTGYVSHSFVIDYKEAKDIFSSVRPPEKDEILFEELIFDLMRSQDDKPIILKAPCDQNKKENNEDGNSQPSDNVTEKEGTESNRKNKRETTEQFETNSDTTETNDLQSSSDKNSDDSEGTQLTVN